MKRINISLVMEMSNSVSSNNPEQIEAKTKKKKWYICTFMCSLKSSNTAFENQNHNFMTSITNLSFAGSLASFSNFL